MSVSKLIKLPQSQSLHDDTEKDKDKPETLASKQKITAYHKEKIVTLTKSIQNFSKSTLQRDGVI